MPSKEFPIYRVPKGQRYWVVRGEGGVYLPHFRNAGVVAIGHLDPLELPDTAVGGFTGDVPSLVANLNSRLAMTDEHLSKAQLTALMNQVNTFVNEVQVNDLVVTPAYSRLLIGRVVSGPFIDHTPVALVTDRFSDTEITMKFRLRREVRWGPLIQRQTFPAPIIRSLRANQTVFCIDDHWSALHHMLFPAFEVNGDLYLSFRILQENPLGNYSIARLLEFLTETEIFARDFLDKPWNEKEFWETLFSAFQSNRLSLSTQAQLMSPGDLWSKFAGLHIGNKMAILVVIHGMLFGNDLLGMHGIIDDHMREKIAEFVMARWENTGGEKIKEDLQLTVPNHDTSAIEIPVPPESKVLELPKAPN